MTPDRAYALDQFAKRILEAKDLRDLHHFLWKFEEECRAIEEEDDSMRFGDVDVENELAFRKVDLTQLPTFGGSDPSDTTGVWSWDEDEMLVGEGSFTYWRIEERTEN